MGKFRLSKTSNLSLTLKATNLDAFNFAKVTLETSSVANSKKKKKSKKQREKKRSP